MGMSYSDFLGDTFNHNTGEFNYEKAEKNAFSNKEKFNVIIMGKTGVGKSALINALFGSEVVKSGVGKPITQHLAKIEVPHKGVVLWDTKGIEAKDYRNIIENLKNEFTESFSQVKHTNDIPHIAWICIDAQGARVEPCDIELIRIAKNFSIPLVVTFTKYYGKSNDAFINEAIDEINKSAELKEYINNKYVRINSVSMEIDENYSIPTKGLDELLDKTFQCLPEGMKSAKNALKKAQMVRMKDRLEAITDSAKKIVHVASLAAGTAGASPIPGSDAPIIAAVQSGMIYKINAEFELDSATANTTAVVTGVLGVTAIAQVGRTVVSNILKFIPGAGSIIGGTISATTAIAITEAVGHAYIQALTYYYSTETGKVELPSEVEPILSLFKEFFQTKKI